LKIMEHELKEGIVVKVKLINDTDYRRIRLPNGTSFLTLRQKLAELFGSNLPQNFIVKYVDDEGDNISITNEIEYKEALNFASATGILKLIIPSEPGKPIKRI